MKKGSKIDILKTFAPNLGFYTKKQSPKFMIPEFHDYPLKPIQTHEVWGPPVSNLTILETLYFTKIVHVI